MNGDYTHLGSGLTNEFQNHPALRKAAQFWADCLRVKGSLPFKGGWQQQNIVDMLDDAWITNTLTEDQCQEFEDALYSILFLMPIEKRKIYNKFDPCDILVQAASNCGLPKLPRGTFPINTFMLINGYTIIVTKGYDESTELIYPIESGM